MEELTQSKSFQTPMMQQYLAIKRQYPDCFLLFRLGDFYELFLDDAKLASEILNITLTARAKGKDGKIPMAGVPYHAATGYINKLVKAGYKVAICDQVSLPNGKTIVDRQVTRVITPGTIMDDLALDASSNNYLFSLVFNKNQLGLALVDVSTGQTHAEQVKVNNIEHAATTLAQVLAQFQPSECILDGDAALPPQLKNTLEKQAGLYIHSRENWPRAAAANTLIKKYFNLTQLKTLGLNQTSAVTRALAGLLWYVATTQQSALTHLINIQPILTLKTLQLDPSTIANLELVSTLHQTKKTGSLLAVIDKTKTAAGGRMLKKWLLQPLFDQQKIVARYDSVEFLQSSPYIPQLIALLKTTSDIERLVSRLAVGLGTPRDLKQLEQTLVVIGELGKVFPESADSSPIPKLLGPLLTPDFDPQLEKLISRLKSSIKDDPPTDPKQGGYIAAKIDTDIDALNQTLLTQRNWMLELEQTQRQATGISSLKVRFNKVFGYYLEVSKSNLDKVPENFIRKQTLVNAERFITPEMKERETIILDAEEKIQHKEYRVFLEVVNDVLQRAKLLQELAFQVARLDCLLGFANFATEKRLTRPSITTDGKLSIKAGRHLIVEKYLGPGKFVPNDTYLDTKTQQIALITGPNMAGKSVLMRQVAQIVLLAHCGSFVPAQQAAISLTDRIFVRSGASDNISQGMSTFMVEMVETAYILRHLTEKSLVIMDEIGRGTSTYDGISIAWAVADFLVQAGNAHPKTLFATHYHELQTLAEISPRIENFRMAIGEEKQETGSAPIFLYTLQKGGASASFGISVAQLAGLPTQVTKKAQAVLENLHTTHQPHHQIPSQHHQERSHQKSTPATNPTNQPAESVSNSSPSQNSISKLQQQIITELLSIPLENTTPLDALNQLADVQHRLKYDTN